MDEMGFGIAYTLRDLFTANAARITQSLSGLNNATTAHTESMSRSIAKIEKGAMGMGAGAAILAVPAVLARSTIDMEQAMAELASLGVKDFKSIEDAAIRFTNTYSGFTAAEIVKNSYDIKSSFDMITDQGIGKFAESVALTAKATKSNMEDMTASFTKAYGSFKQLYPTLSDEDWSVKFSAMMSKVVMTTKTTGAKMSESIKNVGSVLSSMSVPMSEQMAVMGMLQTTMEAADAGTAYKTFALRLGEAGRILGTSFVKNGKVLSMPEIIETIKMRYDMGDPRFIQGQLKDAFGDDSVKVILALSKRVDELKNKIGLVEGAAAGGMELTKEMANIINSGFGSQLQILGQQFSNLLYILGKPAAQIFTPIVIAIVAVLNVLQNLAKAIPGTSYLITLAAIIVGGLTFATGALVASLGMLGLALPAVRAGWLALIPVMERAQIAAMSTNLAMKMGLVMPTLSTAGFRMSMQAIPGILFGFGTKATRFLVGIPRMIYGAFAAAIPAIGTFLAATWPVWAVLAGLTAAGGALYAAWKYNFGGIATFITGLWSKFTLVKQAIGSLVATIKDGKGQISGELADQLNASGMMGAVTGLFRVYYRLQVFGQSVAEGVKGTWSAVMSVIGPPIAQISTGIGAIWSSVGEALKSILLLVVGTQKFNSILDTFNGSAFAAIGYSVGYLAKIFVIAGTRVVSGFMTPIIRGIQGMAIAFNAIAWVIGKTASVISTVLKPVFWLINTLIVAPIKWAVGFTWGIISSVVKAISAAFNTAFMAVGKAVATIVTPIRAAFGQVWVVVKDTAKWIFSAFNGIWIAVKPVFAAIGRFVSATFGVMWSVSKTVFSAISSVVKNMFEGTLGMLSSTAKSIVRSFKVLFYSIAIAALIAIVPIRLVFNVIAWGWGLVASAVKWVSSASTTAFSKIASVASEIVSPIRAAFGQVWDAVRSTFSTIRDYVNSAFGGVSSAAGSVADGFITTFKAIASAASFVGNAMDTYLISPIKSAIEYIDSLGNKALNYMSFGFLGKSGNQAVPVQAQSGNQKDTGILDKVRSLFGGLSFKMPTLPAVGRSMAGAVIAASSLVPASHGATPAVPAPVPAVSKPAINAPTYTGAMAVTPALSDTSLPTNFIGKMPVTPTLTGGIPANFTSAMAVKPTMTGPALPNDFARSMPVTPALTGTIPSAYTGTMNIVPNMPDIKNPSIGPTVVESTDSRNPIKQEKRPAMPIERMQLLKRTTADTPGIPGDARLQGVQRRGGLDSADSRPLLEAVLAKLDALGQRPIDVTVTSKLDGREVARSVYRDVRETKTRNYEAN